MRWKPLLILATALLLSIALSEQAVAIEAMRKEEKEQVIAGSRCHPGATHFPLAISPLGDVVELSDGSRWSVKEWDRDIIQSWLPTDAIFITQNMYDNVAYPFRFIHQDSGEDVYVRMTGTWRRGPQTYYVTSIDVDWDVCQVCLNDGSRWEIRGFDAEEALQSWMLSDTVLIGLNAESRRYPYLLINVALNGYVEARHC